jgi:hypothetical protein
MKICTINSAATAACLVLASLPLRAQEHAPITMPVIAVGDSWTVEYTDLWKKTKGNVNRLEVTSVDDKGIKVDVKRAASGALLAQQRFSNEMNPIDRGSMHFAPAFTRYAFPLEPGKEWTSEATGDNPKLGKHWRYQIKGKVLGWEKITVKAGQFDALKVEVQAFYHGDETGSNGGSGQLTEVLWYAPAVNSYVKLDYNDTDWNGRIYNRDSWELVSYVRKTPPQQASR